MADIFISYAREDRAVAQDVARRAASKGYSVWWDKDLIVGADIHSFIEREIRRARKVIVIWSRNSVNSPWVRDEAQMGLEENKLLPICIDDARPPLGFRSYNIMYVDDWDTDFRRILNAMDPRTQCYTASYVMQEGVRDGGVNTKQHVTGLFTALDPSAAQQTMSYFQRLGLSNLDLGLNRNARALYEAMESVTGAISSAATSATGLQVGGETRRRRTGSRGGSSYADVTDRLTAGVIDVLVTGLISLLFLFPFGMELAGSSAFLGVVLLVWVLYYLIMHAGFKGTLGYRAMGMRLLEARHGRRPSWGAILFVSLVSLFPIGWVWPLWDRKKRMLQNIATSTVVVVNRPAG